MIRLDNELVRRNMFKTRTKAKEAIESGIVFCDGKKIIKAGTNIKENSTIEIKGNIMPYVSKGGLKLEKAIKYFNIDLNNKVMLDIGSSTGGFSDCALQNGIKKIIAIDVGKNQLDANLRDNPKIELYEQIDFRSIEKNLIDDADLAVIDVSFISLDKLTEKLNALKSLKEIICLIKPQFEVGKELADKYKGIILKKELHKQVILKIINDFYKIEFYCNGLTFSPIKGGSGNIEYLAYFIKNKNNKVNINIDEVIDNAFEVLTKKKR